EDELGDGARLGGVEDLEEERDGEPALPGVEAPVPYGKPGDMLVRRRVRHAIGHVREAADAEERVHEGQPRVESERRCRHRRPDPRNRRLQGLGHGSSEMLVGYAFQPPVAPLYVPPKRANGVLARIFKSSHGDRCSTYQRSSSIRSSHGSVARPWTWAQPVIPGFTSSRRAWRVVYCST